MWVIFFECLFSQDGVSPAHPPPTTKPLSGGGSSDCSKQCPGNATCSNHGTCSPETGEQGPTQLEL